NAVALDRGANLALVGEELLQFGRAEPLGSRRWRLYDLWRGRRGSEAAIGGGVSGDRFILIEAAALAQHDLPNGQGDVRVMAVAPGSAAGVECEVVRNGASLVPPSPVALRATHSAGDDVALS